MLPHADAAEKENRRCQQAHKRMPRSSGDGKRQKGNDHAKPETLLAESIDFTRIVTRTEDPLEPIISFTRLVRDAEGLHARD